MPRVLTPEQVTDAGQPSIEHIDTLFDSKLPQDGAPEEVTAVVRRFRQERAPALFAAFHANGTAFTPTLSVSMFPYLSALARAASSDSAPDPREKYVSGFSKKFTRDVIAKYKDLLTPSFLARQEGTFPEYMRLVELMQRSGVALLAGTDFATSVTYPGFGLHYELALLVQAGLTPMEALQAATRNPARLLKCGDLGTIEVGKIADLVLLKADPLQDIRNTRSISTVIFDGVVLDRLALDGILKIAARQASET